MGCLYGVFLGFFCTKYLIEKEQLWDSDFTEPSGEKSKVSIWAILNDLQDKHEFFFIVVIMCTVVTVLLGCFIAYHLYLFLFDYTTNELVKRRNVKYLLNRKLNFIKRWQESS